MTCNEAASDALASWTAAAFCRSCARGSDPKAPDDWRSPKLGGVAVGSGSASIRFGAGIGTLNLAADSWSAGILAGDTPTRHAPGKLAAPPGFWENLLR